MKKLGEDFMQDLRYGVTVGAWCTALVVLLLLTGCASSSAQQASGPQATVQQCDPESGVDAMTVEVTNPGPSVAGYELELDWFDSNGQQTDAVRGWDTSRVEPGGTWTRTIQGYQHNQDTTGWKCYVQIMNTL